MTKRAYDKIAAGLTEAIAATRNERDIAYGPQPRQTLDLFLPADRDARDLPVLFFLHGGGWSIGYKEWCGFMAPAIVSLPPLTKPDSRVELKLP